MDFISYECPNFYNSQVDDEELQDEPLQIRIMDHDTYSANDAIGKVNISLNPLLHPNLDASIQPNQSGKGKEQCWPQG